MSSIVSTGRFSMKEGCSRKSASPSQGGCAGRWFGAVLISLSPPRWEDVVDGRFASVAHFRRGPSCGQKRRGACRSEGLLVGEHVPDGVGESACDVDLGDAGSALFAEPGAGALVAVAVGRVAGGVQCGLDERPAQVLGAL